MGTVDRKNALLAQDVVTGIDFVAVDGSQTVLDVFFLRDPMTLTAPLTDLVIGQVSLTGIDGQVLPLVSIAWPGPVDGREVLRITTGDPGGFELYWLAIDDDRLDPFFARLEVDFKAACPSKLDCEPPEHICPPAEPDDISVDGTARDFWSLRGALLDFAAHRNPRWKDRLEADIGVTVVELMAALGDELAYYQDRVARETHWDTANERRSLRRHARLVDYQLHDGLGARGWLAIEVDPSVPGFKDVLAGTQAWARTESGLPVGFEVGTLADVRAGVKFRAAQVRNRIDAHLWDDDVPDAHTPYRPLPSSCLPAGARELHIQGHHGGDFKAGEHVAVITEPPAGEKDMPQRRWIVTLETITEETDPLGIALGTGADITRLRWTEPTPFEMNLAWTKVIGNIVPITAGVTTSQRFSIGPSTQDTVPRAVERTGRDGAVTFLFTLPDRTGAELVRLGTTPETAEPEVDLFETAPPGWATGDRWEFKHSFVGINVSGPDSRDFTIEDGTWARVVGYQRLGGEVVHQDYLAGVGSTVRFGDGEFGRMPARGNAAAGQDKFFRVRYRLGNGTRGNVAADTVRFSDPNGGTDFSAFGFKVVRVWNPLPTSGGVDAETAAEVRRDAPEAFRAVTYRAVRPEDFDEAAQRLAWVQRAGTSFRWTGSWLTAFTAADPRERADLPPDQRRALAIHLDRFRQAGREVHVLEPRYANLELRIAFCVEASAYAAQVERAVAQALLGRGDRRDGFFAPDRFTFGTPLDRSELEVAIQRVPGVRAVKAIWIRRRDGFAERPFVEPYYQPGLDEVIRVEGDRGHPDRGSVTLEPEGGA